MNELQKTHWPTRHARQCQIDRLESRVPILEWQPGFLGQGCWTWLIQKLGLVSPIRQGWQTRIGDNKAGPFEADGPTV